MGYYWTRRRKFKHQVTAENKLYEICAILEHSPQKSLRQLARGNKAYSFMFAIFLKKYFHVQM